jgi:hypothetical protein
MGAMSARTNESDELDALLSEALRSELEQPRDAERTWSDLRARIEAHQRTTQSALIEYTSADTYVRRGLAISPHAWLLEWHLLSLV